MHISSSIHKFVTLPFCSREKGEGGESGNSSEKRVQLALVPMTEIQTGSLLISRSRISVESYPDFRAGFVRGFCT